MENKIYDLAIIGGGPAGLTASIYASRYKLNNIVISEFMGGLAAEATEVGNFPSYPEISGFELMQKMQDHAFKHLNAENKQAKVTYVHKNDDNTFKLTLDNGNEILAKAVLITTGTTHNKLNVPGEKEFAGRGVSYCATCDAFFYKDKITTVVGGGNTAVTAALYLAKIAKKVYIIHRRDEFRAEPYWVEKLNNTDNIEKVMNAEVAEILGNTNVEKIKLKDGREIMTDGVFIDIGVSPTISFDVNFELKLDERNHIIVEPSMQTSCEGVYAAGDVSNGSNYFKQIATAVGEGAVAADSIYKYLQKQKA